MRVVVLLLVLVAYCHCIDSIYIFLFLLILYRFNLVSVGFSGEFQPRQNGRSRYRNSFMNNVFSKWTGSGLQAKPERISTDKTPSLYATDTSKDYRKSRCEFCKNKRKYYVIEKKYCFV